MFISKNIKKTAIISLVVGFVAVPLAAYAQESDDDTTIITAQISSTISITTSPNVNIPVIPDVGGAQSSRSDTVEVSTNNSDGYTLTLENADSDTELEGPGSNEIAAHDGTLDDPTVLADNSWGYAVPDWQDFDETYSQLSSESSSSVWAGVPALGSKDVIGGSGGPVTEDTTTVWYSVKVDTSKPDGNYVDTVLYTATTL